MPGSGRFAEREEALISLLGSVEEELESYGEEDPVNYNSNNILVGEMHAYESPGFEVVRDALHRNDEIEALGLEFIYGDHDRVEAFNQGWISAEEMAEFYRKCCNSYTGSGFEGEVETVKDVLSALKQRDGDIIGLEFSPTGPRRPENFDEDASYDKVRWSQMAEKAAESAQGYNTAAYLVGADHISFELGTVFSIPGYMSEVAKLPDKLVRSYNQGEISSHDLLHEAKSPNSETLKQTDRLENRLSGTESVLAVSPDQIHRSFDRSMEEDALNFFKENSEKLQQQIENVHESISELSVHEASSGNGDSVSIK